MTNYVCLSEINIKNEIADVNSVDLKETEGCQCRIVNQAKTKKNIKKEI